VSWKAKSGRPNGTVPKGRRRGLVVQVGVGLLFLGVLFWYSRGIEAIELVELLTAIPIALFVALVIRWLVIEPYKIPSASMRPALEPGDRIFVNKSVYGLRFPLNGMRVPFTTRRVRYAARRLWRGRPPKRGDIVVFRTVEEGETHDILVKRVVGKPGERIRIRDGRIHVNGTPLDGPFSITRNYYTAPRGFPVMQYGISGDKTYSLVPPDHYLLLGDNSAASRDGRVFGWVPDEHILGRVCAIWWPLRRWRRL